MIGGGAQVTGNSAAHDIADITTSYQSATNTWRAIATVVVHAANGSPPTLTAYAICAH
jgi:hypothetical protein